MLQMKYCQPWKGGGDQRSCLERSWAELPWEGMGSSCAGGGAWAAGCLRSGGGLCHPQDHLHSWGASIHLTIPKLLHSSDSPRSCCWIPAAPGGWECSWPDPYRQGLGALKILSLYKTGTEIASPARAQRFRLTAGARPRLSATRGVSGRLLPF